MEPTGQQPALCGFVDIKPTKFGLPADNVIRPASDFGELSEVYNGFDVTINARFGRGGILSGGLSTGQTVIDNCLPVDDPSQPFCRQTSPFAGNTQVKLSGVYPPPWWGIQTSAVFQLVPGPEILASHVVSNAEVAPSLGRNLGSCRGAATCNATATIANIIEPGSAYEVGRKQVDVRLTMPVRMSRARLRASLDVYNLFNRADIINLTTRYSATNSWPRPTGILGARLFKVGAIVDF